MGVYLSFPFWTRSRTKRERSRERNSIRKEIRRQGEKVFDIPDEYPRSGYVRMAGPRGEIRADGDVNLYFDESAEPSMSDAYDTFVIGGLAVRDQTQVDRIVDTFPDVDWEYKYTKAKIRDPKGCKSTMEQIRDSDMDIYAKVVRKNREIDNRYPYQVYAETLRDVVSDILSTDAYSSVVIYLDKQSYLDYNDLRRLFAGFDRVKVLDPNEIDGNPGLQLADFVASSIEDYYGKSKERRPEHYLTIRDRIVNKNARRRSVWLINASHGLALNGQYDITRLPI